MYLDGRRRKVADEDEVSCRVDAVVQTVECRDVWITRAFTHGHRHGRVIARNLTATSQCITTSEPLKWRKPSSLPILLLLFWHAALECRAPKIDNLKSASEPHRSLRPGRGYLISGVVVSLAPYYTRRPPNCLLQ